MFQACSKHVPSFSSSHFPVPHPILQHWDDQALQRALLRWLDHRLGKRNPQGDQVSANGKELLNSQGAQVISAYSVQSGGWLGSEAVAEGFNEIPAVQCWLKQVDLEGSLLTADALNTQTEAVRQKRAKETSGCDRRPKR